jgi:phenylpropionate dioxygenase-like ring-hydroxylating dioxygenase large terminal subunit
MDTLGGLADELAPYQIEQMEPIEERNFRLPVNWKAGLENVTDYYHVSTVHQRTVHAHVRDGPDLTRLGDHTRQTLYIAPYAWRRKLDVYCSRGGPYTEKQQSQLHKYLIFPNLVLNVLPYHLTLMQWWPVTPRSSRLRYAFCLRRGAGTVERARAWLSWAYSRVVLHEDIGVLAALQAGLDASPPTEQPLHDEEAAAAHFHGVLDRWMESPE